MSKTIKQNILKTDGFKKMKIFIQSDVLYENNTNQ